MNINSLMSSGGQEKICEVESPSILENLQRQKRNLESKLERVNAALNALEQNPSVTEVLELIAKAQY